MKAKSKFFVVSFAVFCIAVFLKRNDDSKVSLEDQTKKVDDKDLVGIVAGQSKEAVVKSEKVAKKFKSHKNFIPQKTKNKQDEKNISKIASKKSDRQINMLNSNVSRAAASDNVCQNIPRDQAALLAKFFVEVKDKSLPIYPDSACAYDKLFKKLTKVLNDKDVAPKVLKSVHRKNVAQANFTLKELREMTLSYSYSVVQDNNIKHCPSGARFDDPQMSQTYKLIGQIASCAL